MLPHATPRYEHGTVNHIPLRWSEVYILEPNRKRTVVDRVLPIRARAAVKLTLLGGGLLWMMPGLVPAAFWAAAALLASACQGCFLYPGM